MPAPKRRRRYRTPPKPVPPTKRQYDALARHLKREIRAIREGSPGGSTALHVALYLDEQLSAWLASLSLRNDLVEFERDSDSRAERVERMHAANRAGAVLRGLHVPYFSEWNSIMENCN